MALTHIASTHILAMNTDSQQGPPLMRLPLELRQMIYRYLLVAQHARLEHNMRSEDYNRHRRSILCGGDYTYEFHTNILFTNRQIYDEARELFLRENTFVRMISQPNSLSGDILERSGLPMVAGGIKAGAFSQVAMTVSFDPVVHDGWFNSIGLNYGTAAVEYVFMVEDLPAFCTTFLYVAKTCDKHLSRATLHIAISAELERNFVDNQDGTPQPRSELKNLLEPFRKLHNMSTVNITGPGNATYKSEIIADMCGRRASAKETLQMALAALDHADEIYNDGSLSMSMSIYKHGLDAIRGSFFDSHEQYEILDQGRLAGMIMYQAWRDTEVKLHARIAASYLEHNKLRMARIYAERAYGPVHSHDDKHNAQKLPLGVRPEYGYAFADVLLVAAKISYQHGRVREAIDELKEAARLSPGDDDVQRLLEEYIIRYKKCEDRRREVRERRVRKQHRNFEDLIHVAYMHEKQADNAFRADDFAQSRRKYEKALNRLEAAESLEVALPYVNNHTMRKGIGDFEGYSTREVLVVFRLRLRASLAATCFRLGEFKTVCDWADAATAPDNKHWDEEKECLQYYSPKDHIKAYYSKAVALEQMGDLDEAIQALMLARTHDRHHQEVRKKLIDLVTCQK